MAEGGRGSDPGAAFVAFARTRDPKAFVAAFDATAADLLLVASRLARRGTGAEDLLQDTWLAALRRADAYDAKRPLLPWLLGILVQEARMRRRGESRARARDAAAAQARAADGGGRAPDPLETAARKELAADAAEALAQIDERHRQVLVLRLVYGLTSVEIGHALGRAPDTVRMQLARGLDKLRRALPRGHALLAGALVDAGRLEAVRAALFRQLLGQAAGTGLAAASLTTIGLLAMKNLVLGALALAGVGLASWLALREPAGASASGTARRDPVTATAAAGGPSAHESRGEAATRVALPASAAGGAAAGGARRVTVRGRIVDPDMLPRAGARVTLALMHVSPSERFEQELEHGDLAWSEPVAVTPEDGSFALAFENAPTPRYRLRCEHAGCAPVEIPLRIQMTDVLLGDIVLYGGVRVTGRVVDAKARPLVDREVLVQQQLERLGPRSSARFVEFTTAEDGTFIVPELLEPCTARFMLRGQGLEPGSVELSSERARVHVELTARFSEMVAGAVFDPDGAPVAGAYVHCSLPSGPGAWTDAKGRFWICRRPDDPAAPFPIAVQADGAENLSIRATGFERTQTEPVAWGTEDLRIMLRRNPTVRIIVRDAHGLPVERFGVRASLQRLANGSLDMWSRTLRDVGRHEGGALAMTSLERGLHALWIDPGPGPLAPSLHRLVEVGDANPEQVFVLSPKVAVRFVVATKDGALLAGSQVEVGDRIAYAASSFKEGFLHGIAKGTTGPDGAVTLQLPRGGPMRVRATGKHEELVDESFFVAAGTDTVPLVVAAGATVAGRLTPPDLFTHGLKPDPLAEDSPQGVFFDGRVVVQAGAGVRLPADDAAPVRVGPDGTFEIRGIPPGDWSLAVFVQTRAKSSIGYRTHVVSRLPALRDGAVHRVELDLAALRPIRARGRLLWNGRPAPGGTATLTVLPQSTLATTARTFQVFVDLDPEGRFSGDVLAGQVRLSWRPPQGDHSLGSDQTLTLTAKDQPELEFQVRSAPLDARLVGGDERRPLAGVALELALPSEDASPIRLPATDADGRARLEHAPLGAATLRARLGGTDAQPVELRELAIGSEGWRAEVVMPRAAGK